MVIAGLVTIFYLPNAYSDFSPNSKYLVEASGYLSGNQTIFDSTIALQLTMGTKNGNTIQTTLDNGLVTIADAHYLNSGAWQTSILRDGKYFIIQGDAQDQNGNVVHLNLFGRIINSNQDGSVYSITGKITGSETMKVIYSAKIISANTISIKPTTVPTTQTPTTEQPSSGQVSISIVYGASDINNQVHFTPSSLQVAPGTTIVWTNNDSVPHRIMSGIAKAVTIDQSSSVFAGDGMIDSGIIAPGQSYSFTIKEFDRSKILDPKTAALYNIPPEQTVGDITFFDPTYQFMVGVISPLLPPPPGSGIVQMSIVSGASNPNNEQFLSPSNIRITAGQIVEIINNDSVPHQILSGQSITTTQGGATSNAPAKQPQFAQDNIFDSNTIAPGQHVRITVSKIGTLQIFDPQYTWINGVIVSSSTTSSTPITPIQISISPGSSLQKGTATQQTFNQYNTYYVPDTIQLVPGTPVIWVNNDSIEHTILSGISTQKYQNNNPFTPDGIIASGKIAPGQTFTVIINGTGIIRFYDPQYWWMNGIIISQPQTQSRTIAAPSMNSGLH
jgi:plastocyanin